VGQALNNSFIDAVSMVQNVPHPANPDFRMLANPLKIDGQRLQQKVCSPLGADNETLLGSAQPRAAAE
jgi:hypothetical protein